MYDNQLAILPAVEVRRPAMLWHALIWLPYLDSPMFPSGLHGKYKHTGWLALFPFRSVSDEAACLLQS
jgi:hypothetical protein